MAYEALYRRYRPGRFGDVHGQQHVMVALRNAVSNGRVGHAYLFSGPRGTGKTSSARILAKALNCTNLHEGEPCGECASCASFQAGTAYDLRELDAASNNGVEAMRDLISKVGLSAGGHGVFILDEVHMLSTGAENALLKTLEEPPPNVTFILATTEPNKVVPTIRSRTQHFEFTLLPADELVSLVHEVAEADGLTLTDNDVDYVVRQGRGSARDTLSALDQVVAAGGAPEGGDHAAALLDALAARDGGAALVAVNTATQAGREPELIGRGLLADLRNAFLAVMGASLSHLSEADQQAAHARGQAFGPASITRAMEVIGSAVVDMRQAPDPRVDLELAVVRLTRPEVDLDAAALLSRIEHVESALAGGAVVSAAPATAGGPAPASPAPVAEVTAPESAPPAPGPAAVPPEPVSSEPVASTAAPVSTAPPAGAAPPANAPAPAAPAGGAGRPADIARASLRQKASTATERVDEPADQAAPAAAPAGAAAKPTLGATRRAQGVTDQAPAAAPPPAVETPPEPSPAPQTPAAPATSGDPAPHDGAVVQDTPAGNDSPPVYDGPPAYDDAPLPNEPPPDDDAPPHGALTAPPGAMAPAAVAEPAPAPAPAAPAAAAVNVPSREVATAAWSDSILSGLPGRVKSRFSAGEFLDSEPDSLVFALPNDVHRQRCEDVRADVDDALAAHFGGPIPFKLVTGTPGPVPGPSSRSSGPSAADAPNDATMDDESMGIDLQDLTDAPSEGNSVAERLSQAFPGSEIMDTESSDG